MKPPVAARPVGRYLNRPARAAPPLRYAAPASGSWGPLLLGLLLLAVVGWLAIKHYTPTIQEDLLERSRASLDKAGFAGSTDVAIDGRNIALTGNVASAEERNSAEEAVLGTFGVRSVDNQLTVGAADTAGSSATSTTDGREVPSFAIASGDGGITLTGTVSDQKFSDALAGAAAVQYEGMQINNEITVDPNATNPGWSVGVAQLMPDLKTIDGGALSIADGTATITGTADSEETKTALGDKAQALLGTQLSVDNQIDAPEPVQPEPVQPEPVQQSLPAFASVSETDSEVTLTGFMSAEGATAVATAYESTGKTVINNISTNDLAETPAWVESFNGALSKMEGIEGGKLTVARSGSVTINGTVESDEQKQSTGDDVAELFGDETNVINNLVVAAPPVVAPPEVAPPVVPTMTPFASVKQSVESIMVSGLLPEPAAKSLLESFSAGDKEVIDRITVDERVMQPQWSDALGQSLERLDPIDNSSINIASNGTLTLKGEAETEQAKQFTGITIGTLFGNSVSLRNDITVKIPTIVEPPKPDIRALLAELDLTGIRFRSGSADIDGESQDILNEVVNVLNLDSEAQIVIAGHTDSRGNPDYNFSLSADRADAVQQFLVSRGISSGRLTARGYGPTQPIASNDTAEGRALNRRIEIQLIGE